MASIKGQPAPKPTSLAPPVPTKEAELTAEEFLSDIPELNADSFLADIPEANGQPTTQPSLQSTTPTTEMVDQGPSVMGVSTDLGQQVRDLPDRIAASIAGDPASVELTMKKRLGEENVRSKDGAIYIKKPGDKAFRKLDPGTFEIISDTIGDFYKEAIQGLGGAIGGAAGLASPAPGGAIAGTALGVATASAGLDAYGKERLGVVKANQGTPLEETGKYLKEGAEYAMLDRIFKGLGDKWAARKQTIQGLKKLNEISPTDRLQESVKTNMQTLDELRNLGMTKRITGTNIDVPAHQLLPHDPKVLKIAESVSANQSFQNAQKEAAENFGNAAIDLMEEAADITKGKLKETIKTGVPSSKSLSAADVTGLFNKVRRAEGAVLGEFRQKVAKETGKMPLPIQKTTQTISDIFNKLGVTVQGGAPVFPEDDALAQILGTDSKPFINGLKKDLSTLFNKAAKGGMTIDEVLGQSQILGAKNEGANRVGGLYKSMIGRLSSSMREDSRNLMGQLLSPEDAIEYSSKMKRFSSISKSMEQLDSYLRDDIGLNTFAKGLVNKGKEGLANLRAAKEFLTKEDPQMYKNLIGEFFEELALKNRDTSKIATFNPQGMRKELASLGGEYLDELFPKNGPISKSLVLRTFDLSDQLQKSIIKGTDDEVRKAAGKVATNLNAWNRGVNAASALMHFGSKNNRLLKLLSRDGVESFLSHVPQKERPALRETFNAILVLGRRAGTLATINNQDQIMQGGRIPEGP